MTRWQDWNADDWAALLAALEPYGWGPDVDEDTGAARRDNLRHEGGAWARLSRKGDVIVTDGWPVRENKLRMRADGSIDWQATAAAWQKTRGVPAIESRAAYDAAERAKVAGEARLGALADSLLASVADVATGYHRRVDASSASVRLSARGTSDAYGEVRIYPSGTYYVADWGGSNPRSVAAIMLAVADWIDAQGGAGDA